MADQIPEPPDSEPAEEDSPAEEDGDALDVRPARMLGPCSHRTFDARVEINRLSTDEGDQINGYQADLRIWCQGCGQPFVFLGVPSGASTFHPCASPDGQELRAPITPTPRGRRR